jgi:hypothetical protein
MDTGNASWLLHCTPHGVTTAVTVSVCSCLCLYLCISLSMLSTVSLCLLTAFCPPNRPPHLREGGTKTQTPPPPRFSACLKSLLLTHWHTSMSAGVVFVPARKFCGIFVSHVLKYLYFFSRKNHILQDVPEKLTVFWNLKTSLTATRCFHAGSHRAQCCLEFSWHGNVSVLMNFSTLP